MRAESAVRRAGPLLLLLYFDYAYLPKVQRRRFV
jgi:hypothetical protein